MNILRYRSISPIIWKQKIGLLKLLGLALLAAGVTALMPWPMKLLVDYALADLPSGIQNTLLSSESIWANPGLLIAGAAVASIILFALASVISVTSSWLWSKIGQRMVVDLSMVMFERLQRLSKLFHTRHPVADSLGRLTVDSWCVFTIAQALLITPVQNLITIVVVGIVAWQIDPYLALLSLAIAPVLGASTVFFGERLRVKAELNREAQSRVMAFVHQTITAVPLVQAFGRERSNSEKFRSLSNGAVSASQKNYLLDNGFTLVNGITLSVGLAIVLVAGGQRVVEGAITVGSLLVFLGYLQALQGETESLLSTYKNLKSAEANLNRVLEVLEADGEIASKSGASVLARDSESRALSVTFENISFSYEPDRPVLKNINLHINAGETVALVGSSGSGKSTLASLIPRFFDWDDGRILLDGKDVMDIDLASLRDQVSVVLQDPFLLPITIAANISYGSPRASRTRIIEAATTASASAFIKKLPKGFDTVLGEKGASLSGGQRQRLAIARAILKNAPVLVLDEPTSALDARTETLFFEALSKLMRGRTTVIVAHRLSTIRDADRIVVVDQGEIAEQGNHEELMEKNGLYAELVRLQSTDTPLVEAA